jgi:hypothetical protein
MQLMTAKPVCPCNQSNIWERVQPYAPVPAEKRPVRIIGSSLGAYVAAVVGGCTS